MRLWKSRRWQRTGRGLIALAMIMALIPATAYARPLAADTISGNVTWNAGRTLTTDVVIANGAKLTIEAVTITAQGPDASPSPKGASDKIEIIVDTGGTLIVKPGAKLTANVARGWGGVVFLEGSSGEVRGATISNGIAGIIVVKASPTIQGNRIQDIAGEDGNSSLKHGSTAYAIAVDGPSSAKIINNTIVRVAGGDGLPGADGGNPGDSGTDGNSGGYAIGINVAGGGDYVVRGNSVRAVCGALAAGAAKAEAAPRGPFRIATTATAVPAAGPSVSL